MLHLRPRPSDWQHVISEQITTDPLPARKRDSHDHFGNLVTWLFLDLPHADFEVIAESVVQVDYPSPPPPQLTPAWESVAEMAKDSVGWRAAEFRFDSPMVPAEPQVRDYAQVSFPRGRSIFAGLLDLNTRIRRDFRFRSGVTTVTTPVSEVMRRREGVCQDFAQLMISGLRGLGLPARYVSGYLRTRPPPGQPRRLGSDQSHAWVGCWLGIEHGWVDLDPTNDLVVKDEHVMLGWGRDYGDVSPIRGIILGGGRHSLSVSVDLEPESDP
jgi:transglutaminase-like putative cysteine protease